MPSIPLGYEQVKAKSFLKPGLIEDTGNQHMITIAPTGSGKGVSCIIPTLLSWTGPAIVIDPKGENFAVTANFRRALGQQVYVLDPFAVTGATCDRLNPLDLLHLEGSDPSDDITTIISLLMKDTASHKQDPFWDERAGTMLAGLLANTVEIHRAGANVQMLFSQLNAHYDQVSSTMRLMLASKRPEIVAAGAVLDVNMSGKTGSSILATAQLHISFLRNPVVGDSLSDSTIPLQDVIAGGPLTIYVVLPTEKLRTHSKLLRLWLGTLMTALSRRKSPPPTPTLLLLDEAAQLGELDELRTALTLLRGSGVKVWSFWQDLSQLRRLYPSDWQSLLNNCGVQQYFGAVSPFAAAEIEMYLMGMAPRSVFGMKKDEMIILRDREPPRMITRLDYLRDTAFRKLASPNPYYREHQTAEILEFPALPEAL